MDFDWNDLPFFLAVASQGNLNRAATALGVNHSTVFRRINGMEERTGVRLFERQPEGYLLTAAGEQVLQHARDADAAVNRLQRAVAGRDAELGGQVRMTAAPDLARRYVAPALAAFARIQPGIRVELAASDSDYDLGRREADLALRATSRPPDHLVGRRVLTLTWQVYAAKAYVERHGAPLSMADLDQHALIGSDQGLARVPVFAHLRRRFPPERFAATTNDLATMAALSASGLGLALLPADQREDGLVPLFPVDPPYASEIWILTHPDLRRVPRIRALSRFLFDYLRSDPALAHLAS
jgi:DNA-binding transcriptional LysR family regulator